MDFKINADDVCYFEQFGGFWAWQDDDLLLKLKEIEEKYNCTVYAITHEYTEFGELYDFLLVTDYKEEWDSLLEHYKNKCHSFVFPKKVLEDIVSQTTEKLFKSDQLSKLADKILEHPKLMFQRTIILIYFMTDETSFNQ